MSESNENRRPGIIQKVSLTIIGSLEKFFYNWGYNIACHPWAFITGCIFLTLACSVGLLSFTPENVPIRLWIPWNSEFVRDSDWLQENYPSPIRFHYAIILADDVLQPSVLETIYNIHNEVLDLSAQNITWKDVCFKLPVTNFFGKRRRKRRQAELLSSTSTTTAKTTTTTTTSADLFDFNFDEDFDNPLPVSPQATSDSDPTTLFDDEQYCAILDSLDEECWESNLAEMWDFDKGKIKNLTKEEIVNLINGETISPIFGRPINYTTELGEIQRNSTGHIVKASAILLRWYAKINQNALLETGKATNDLGTGEIVDRNNLIWEEKLAKTLLLRSQSMPEGMQLYFKIARSFGDISGSTIMNDAGFLAIGFSIVFIYVVFMLGKFNMVEQRPWLSLAGLSCVGLAILVSYGICSAFRIIYGPVHNVLPFLLMGIGIDDMFVIMICYNNLSQTEAKRSLPERMGLTLKHAGVSITVTSVTDFVAFAIGGTTVLPALQSFCIYAALGVIATYIFQATFFVAWFSLDQRRIEKNRNAFFPCIVHTDYKPNEWSQNSFAQMFFDKYYAKYIFKTPIKILVFLVTAILFGINIYGNVLLRQEFNPIWFLPSDSYLFQYYSIRDKYFPGRGDDGFVMIQNVSFPENLRPLESLVTSLEASENIYEVDAWYNAFKKYTNKRFDEDVSSSNLTSADFQNYLGKFLFSPAGSKYRGRFKFDGNLTCGESAPDILLTNIGFKLKLFNGPEEHLPAMREIKSIVRNTNFNESSGRAFAWSWAFAGWETDEIITVELYRNMALAMSCVLLTTLLLIANLSTCIMVLTCVALTLVDVGGMMHFWNLTIDTVSCIDLVLAIGLCVDYAAHIGHAFMTVTGSRNERARKAIVNIGPAVLNGGFSTFLAFILLANSKSHVFITFFKIFFLVVVFGLFHGLVFLPVLLSVIGPNNPYPSAFKRANPPEVAMSLNPTTKTIQVPNDRENGSNMNGNLTSDPENED